MRLPLSLSLSGALVLSLAAPAFAAFSDVTGTHLYARAIAYVQDRGIVEGYSDGTYRPDATLNRAEFTKIMIGSLYSSSEIAACATGSIGLSDVPATAWFAPYVCIAVRDGIVNGYPDKTFGPDRTINFAETSKIVAIAMLDAGISAGNPWWVPYVNALGDAGALPITFTTAEQALTRGEMAEIIYRIEGDSEGTLGESSESSESSQSSESSAQYLPYNEGVIGNGQTAVLFFYAPWCPYCQANDRRLNEWFDSNLPDVTVYKIDYDTSTTLKARFGVTVQDTFVKIDGSGNATGTVSFPSEAALKEFLGM